MTYSSDRVKQELIHLYYQYRRIGNLIWLKPDYQIRKKIDPDDSTESCALWFILSLVLE